MLPENATVVVEGLDQRDGSPRIAKVDEPSVVGKGESSGRRLPRSWSVRLDIFRRTFVA